MKLIKTLLIAGSVLTLAACQNTAIKSDEKVSSVNEPVKAETQVNVNGSQLFEVHADGRIYVFYDFDAYQHFLKLGHTPYMYTRIGAGPKGETMVFSLTKDDKKKRSGIPSVDLFDGKLMPAEDFYAEMNLEGRTYVFDRWEDMKAVRKLGEAPYRHAKIGYGAKGETVVFVLNKTNKKKHPEALINKFNSMNKK